MDTRASADILGELRHVLKSRTSLIIAHRIATVKDADHIVVLADGRIVEQGTHQALIARNGAYARMVDRELKDDRRPEEIEEANAHVRKAKIGRRYNQRQDRDRYLTNITIGSFTPLLVSDFAGVRHVDRGGSHVTGHAAAYPARGGSARSALGIYLA